MKAFPKNSPKNSRRHFLKTATGILAAVPVAIAFGKNWDVLAKSKSKNTEPTPLPEGKAEVPATDPVAQAIGYVSDTKKADQVKYPQHKTDQACHNCALFTKINDGWGTCQMMPASGVVNAHGWCGSWNKKS